MASNTLISGFAVPALPLARQPMDSIRPHFDLLGFRVPGWVDRFRVIGSTHLLRFICVVDTQDP